MIIFFGALRAVLIQAVRQDGRVAGFDILGVTMYTCVVWTVNCQLALYISYFTWIQHFVIWGSILIWYTFLVIYGLFPAAISTTAYHVFWEACASSPLYWLSTLVIVVTALIPFFLYKITRPLFYPLYHDQVQRTNSKNWWCESCRMALKELYICRPLTYIAVHFLDHDIFTWWILYQNKDCYSMYWD